VDAVLSTSAAILQTLTEGPRYGRDLIRALKARAHGTVNPRPGTVYRAAEALVTRRLLRTWIVVPGGRRGARARRYYELTTKGAATAEEQRKALARLFRLVPSPARAIDTRLMSARLRRSAEVSAFALKLQRGVVEASKRRS
jgi:DNA-binding PadR family transcriptional regulator